jgi:RNA polymerase sigma-70 factor (ECF subfamily)
MESKDTSDLIGCLIAQLPTNQREVIHLRDVEGYSYQEIAIMLNLELNHVKVLLHRARTRVRQALIKADEHGITNAG